MADLANEPWTLFPPDSFFGAVIADAFRANGHEPPRLTVTSVSFNVQRELLATGRFLTVLPELHAEDAASRLSLKALPVSLTNSRMPIGIITLKDRSLTPPVQLFIEKLRAYARPLADH